MNTSPLYAGFWLRVAATLIDTVWLCAIVYTLLFAVLGGDALQPHVPYHPLRFVLEWVLPISVVIGFWVLRSATPGKMLLKMKIVDAQTLGPVPLPRLLLRYAGYYVSAFPLMLGLMWVGWDSRKQGWHDKLAGTLVIRTAEGMAESKATPRATSTPHDDVTWPT